MRHSKIALLGTFGIHEHTFIIDVTSLDIKFKNNVISLLEYYLSNIVNEETTYAPLQVVISSLGIGYGNLYIIHTCHNLLHLKSPNITPQRYNAK